MKRKILNIIIFSLFLSMIIIPLFGFWDVYNRELHPRHRSGYYDEENYSLRIQPVLEWQNKYYAGRMPLRLLIASIVGFCLTIGTILFVREEDITNESSTIHKSEHSGSESRDADKSSEEES